MYTSASYPYCVPKCNNQFPVLGQAVHKINQYLNKYIQIFVPFCKLSESEIDFELNKATSIRLLTSYKEIN